MSLITPTLSGFSIASRIYGDGSFNLTDPSSNNTNPAATFTFTSSNPYVADISSVRTVIIRNSGETTITATQAPTSGYTSAQITAVFTVTKATTVMSNFIIYTKELGDGSFNLIDPLSNNPSVFLYEVLTPSIISLSNRTVTLLQLGVAQIRVSQDASTNYTSSFAIATFDVLSNIVRVGTQNRIDLSWNIPQENGGTIKNYFFYNEERQTTIVPGPSISTIMTTTPPINTSYYSYALPVPYSAKIISANGVFTGIDVNSANQSFNINTSSLAQHTASNFFDMGYYGEIEVNWEYHNHRLIVELNPNLVASTTMTLSIYKEASANTGDKRVDLLINSSRTYDSVVNCLGPMPQNNNKTITDIFVITFPSISSTDTTTASRDLKYLKHTDIVSGRVTISSNTYSPAAAPSTTREYSIIVKSIRIAPFRFPISRDFTSLRLGQGISTPGIGFSVSTHNALYVAANDSSGGVLYHMPKLTRPLTDYGKASWTFSWNYAANLSKIATDISYFPVADLSSNLNIPFTMRIRGYSRPYSKTTTQISDISYNTTSVSSFLSNLSDASYNTRMLFDISFSDAANYHQIAATSLVADSSFGIVSRTFDISGASGFAPFSELNDYSHTQFVFLFQLSINDPSYNAYFRMMNSQTDSFQVKMLSQTFTPHQVYRFAGPDPTLESSNLIDSSSNTLYDIKDYYTQLAPNYSFYNLTNGNYYSYAISANNIVGTSLFSDRFTRRCGSIPNQIVNRINTLGTDTFTIESERTSNRVNLYWEKPSFSGYEIQYFSIQTDIDISGRWVTSLEYTPDISNTLISFNTFKDTILYITDETKLEYDTTISSYTYKSNSAREYVNTQLNMNTPLSGTLFNGYKYYFRLSSGNELGNSTYSSILSGIPFARPENSPVKIIGTPIIGDQIAIITWKIPQDDAGSPILNYIIDYEEVVKTGSNTTYINKNRYKQTEFEHSLYAQPNRGYPFDDFRRVYAGYKRYSLLTTTEQANLTALRNQISSFIIHPRPITLNDPDRFLNKNMDLSRNNVILSYTNRSFVYKSPLLNQNVFDLSNIQLKWYYTQDPDGGLWSSDISSSFRLMIRGDLQHNSNDRSRDISGIFDISAIYQVTIDRFSTPTDPTNPLYKYIDYSTGSEIVNSFVPNKLIKLKLLSPPTMYRIDANKDDGYYLILDYTISNISNSNYKFIFYSGQVILNGVAPVRTYTGLNTEFTLTLRSNIYSPFVNGKEYLFTVTPFNINDFFPDLSLYGTGPSQVSFRMGGSTFKDPITDMSYSLVSTSQGGIVVLQWKYSSSPRYYIDIVIPTEYVQENIYPQEYEPLLQSDGNTPAIITPNLDPVNGIVTYTIPSSLQIDISASNAQKYLKSGRGYKISVSPVQTFINNQNETEFIPAPYSNMYSNNTYIIPFRVPNAPLSLSAQGYDGTITLKWKLPDFSNDPNFYQTDVIPSYYRYKYFTLERRDISGANSNWQDVSNEIFIPTADNGGVPGYQAVFPNISGTNELPIQFRIRNVIVNEYNGARAFSGYTYMSMINNIPVIDSLNSSVYPSLYPYKPSTPSLRSLARSSTISGALNGIAVLIDYPDYNGNADYYECVIEYTPPSGSLGSGTTWYDVFDVNNSIADLSFNISVNSSLFTTNRRFRTTSATIGGYNTLTVICRFTVAAFGIRVRLYPRKNGLETGSEGLYLPYGENLYSGYSNIKYIQI
jgi:hypothetical protein